MLACLCAVAPGGMVDAKTTRATSADNAPEPVPRVLDIAVGAQRQIAPGHALQRIAVGDPAVADVLWLKSSGGVNSGLLLVGKSAGRTEMMLWEKGSTQPRTFTVNVTTQAARELLGSDTPAVDVLGGTAVLTGSAANVESHQRALAVAKDAIGKSADGAAGSDSKDAGKQDNGSSDAAASATKGGGVYDASTVAVRPVVQVDVKVVEFSKSVLKQAGFNLFKQNNAFAFGTFSPSSLTSYTGGGDDQPAGPGNIARQQRLQPHREPGHARHLRQP